MNQSPLCLPSAELLSHSLLMRCGCAFARPSWSRNPQALKSEVDRLEKLTGKATKPPATGGGGDKKLTDDELLAEELKNRK